jgi:hypothetical protein
MAAKARFIVIVTRELWDADGPPGWHCSRGEKREIMLVRVRSGSGGDP